MVGRNACRKSKAFFLEFFFSRERAGEAINILDFVMSHGGGTEAFPEGRYLLEDPSRNCPRARGFGRLVEVFLLHAVFINCDLVVWFNVPTGLLPIYINDVRHKAHVSKEKDSTIAKFTEDNTITKFTEFTVHTIRNIFREGNSFLRKTNYYLHDG